MSTVILYSKNDALDYLSQRPLGDKILPLTPNASAEIKGKVDIPILDPLNYFSDYSHRKVLAKVRSVEKSLYQLLYSNKDLSEAAKETFRGMFNPLVCKILYLWYSIRDVGPWTIKVGETWKNEESLYNAHNLLCSQINLMGKGLFNGSFNSKVKRQKPYLPIVTNFLNCVTFKIIKNNKLFFITGNTSGFKSIEKKLNENDNNNLCFIQFRGGVDFKSIIISILSLFKYLINKSQSLIYLINPKPQAKTKSIIKTLLEDVTDPILLNVSELILSSLNPAILYTEGLSNGLKNVNNFKKHKNITLIAHELRLLENAVVGEFVKNNNFRSLLISHGSHPTSENITSDYAHRENAQGLLISSLATICIAQSPLAEKVAKNYMPNLQIKKNHPILWGYNNLITKQHSNNKMRTILHAGTTNKLNGRPWIYETSNEFVHGLKSLVSAVDELKNTQLIIRVRPNLEWSVDSLERLLPDSSNYKIKTTGSFLDDLLSADLMISFSSTTIEEALYARKPVGLFGGTNRYYHLKGSTNPPSQKNRSAVYHLKQNNLSTMLDSILDFHKNSLLTDEELNGYIWDSNVSGYTEFLNYLNN